MNTNDKHALPSPHPLLRVIILIVALLPVVAVIQVVSTYGLNIPFYDQWDTSLDIAVATADGRLSPDLLARQHGDHRIFFTNLTTALVTAISNWDLRVERMILLLLVALSAALLVMMLESEVGAAAWWALIPILALLFAVRGRQTFLVSFQTAFVYPMLFAILCLFALQRMRVGWRTLMLMALCAFCATFSLGSGLVIWLATIPALWLRGYRRLQHFAAWCFAAFVSVGLYYVEFSVARTQSEFSIVLQQPAAAATYLMVYLGGVFAAESQVFVPLAIVFGVIGCVLLGLNLALLFAKVRGTECAAVWIGLALFALGLAGITAVGRLSLFLGESPAQPMSERYIIHASLFWIAVVALGVHNLQVFPQPGRLRSYGRLLRIVNVVVFIVLCGFYTDAAVRTATTEPFPPPSAEVCYRAYVAGAGGTDCFWQFYPPMFPQVPQRIALYERYGFAGASSNHD